MHTVFLNYIVYLKYKNVTIFFKVDVDQNPQLTSSEAYQQLQISWVLQVSSHLYPYLHLVCLCVIAFI